jgi:hypothetical protein
LIIYSSLVSSLGRVFLHTYHPSLSSLCLTRELVPGLLLCDVEHEARGLFPESEFPHSVVLEFFNSPLGPIRTICKHSLGHGRYEWQIASSKFEAAPYQF